MLSVHADGQPEILMNISAKLFLLNCLSCVVANGI